MKQKWKSRVFQEKAKIPKKRPPKPQKPLLNKTAQLIVRKSPSTEKERTSTNAPRNIPHYPSYLDSVTAIAITGASDEDMAQTLGVPFSLWIRWRKAYPSFVRAIEEGRSQADINVTHALYNNAVGYRVKKELVKVLDTGQVARTHVNEFIPGSTEAQKFWLKNRQQTKWKERSETNVNATVTVQEKRLLIDSIVHLLKPQTGANAVTIDPPKPKQITSDDSVKSAETQSIVDTDIT